MASGKSMTIKAALTGIEDMYKGLWFVTERTFICSRLSPFLQVLEVGEGVKSSIQNEFEVNVR